MSDAARAIQSEIETERGKPKKEIEFKRLKQLKADLTEELEYDGQRRALEATLDEAFEAENYDLCHELSARLGAMRSPAEVRTAEAEKLTI